MPVTHHAATGAASAIRVLIVEDSDADAQVLQALLNYYGCESTRVKRLSHALDALRAGSPDVVLLDLGLPDSSGLQTLERLMESTRSVPVVILTGANDEVIARAAVASGAQDYLPKGLTDGRTLVRSIQYARERHRSEQRLRASEERFRALVEKSADGIALLDRSRITLYTSPAITRLLGWEVEEFEGRDVLAFVHEDDREEARQSFDAVLTGALQNQITERRYLCRDGGWRILEVTRTNRLADPAVGAVVINYRDVTEKRRLEEQVAQGQRVASLGRVAASVAHEFNNVLMGIQPFADVIRNRAAADEQVRAAAERILEHTRRGARLTTQILRYTNPAEPLFETLDLGAWVRSFDDEWKNLVQDRSLRVDTGEPLVVRADPTQLHQIITNLLVNARDATPAGGAIRIGAAHATSYPVITRTIPDAERFATLYVRDDGCGIEPAVQKRLFEPLFTTKRRGGTGLGLAIAHQIVTEHGGRMLVESEPGRGACFHVVLPTSLEA
jgi:PAS domain S-box-containing protein